jgi:precorrin-6Y C5,15-methyltransferase (decarboxylating)
VSKAWLSVIGINENGVSGLSEQARELVAQAALVVGGKRHLELAGDLVKGRSYVWDSPIEKTIEKIMAMRPLTSPSPQAGEGINRVCVLASGDPFCYGIGATLVRHIPISEMLVIPAPSCFSLAAGKLGWSLPEVAAIGLNGRAMEKIIPYLQPKAKILALSTDETTPGLLAELLCRRGFGGARFWVLEHLGGDKEIIRETIASEFKWNDIAKLNMLAIEIKDDAKAKERALPVAPGLPDDLFEHDGQISKREIRAVTLSSLAPRRGELLWDIGLGSGSVAIEWLLADPLNRAIGFEKNSERAERAASNALALGVQQLRIMQGNAPDILEGAEAPDAVFIGGGAGNPEIIEFAWNALKPGGRLVVNSVTLETEAVIIAAYKKYGGSIIRIGIDRSEEIGSMTGFRPAMRVTQWSISKWQ